MQRQLLGAALLALSAAATGCNPGYVAGRCDCQYNPANAVIAPASNPYPVIGGVAPAPGTPGSPGVPGVTVPNTMPMATPPVTPGK